MAGKTFSSLTVLAAFLIVLGGEVGALKKLTHPAFTGAATLNLKVLYW